MNNSSSTSSNWLCRLLKHLDNREALPNKEAVRLALAHRPEAEEFRAWLARRSLVLLQPLPVDSPQWEARKRCNEAQLELLREIYGLIEKQDV
jgi:hypothetical protein